MKECKKVCKLQRLKEHRLNPESIVVQDKIEMLFPAPRNRIKSAARVGL